MINTKNIFPLSAALLFWFYTVDVNACPFHGGFGGEPWQHYGSPYSKMQPAGSNNEASSDAVFSITSPAMVKGTLTQALTISAMLRHDPKSEIAEFDLELDGHSSIKTINVQKTRLSKSKMEYVYTIMPQSAGTYKLLFKATAQGADQPVIKRSITYLYITEL